jgi:hypothetical protein
VECRHVRRGSVETEIVSAVRIDLELRLRIDGQPHVGVSGIVGQEVDDAERAEEPNLSVANRGPCVGGESGPYIDSVLFGPFSRHQLCNRASRERPREGARFGLSGEAVGVGSSARTVPYVFTVLRSALGDAVRQRRLSANPDRPGPRPRTCQRPAAGDAGMDRAELGRFLSWATPRIRTSPWAGGCSRPPGPLHGHCSRADPRREASRGYHEGLGGLVSKTPRAPDLQKHQGRRVGAASWYVAQLHLRRP